ncbi:MAG: peptidase domain-containing ABC transporter [Chitinophaga sp.]|nr:peptidase domain-containing ABC transporter [Chitinophaga sp.]
MDCGPTCLRIISKYYGKSVNIEQLRKSMGFSKTGVSLLGISQVAEEMGFRTRGLKVTYDNLISSLEKPCIIHWKQSHFVVCLPTSKFSLRRGIRVVDPEVGVIRYSAATFKKGWISSVNEEGESIGTILLLSPTNSFFENTADTGADQVTWTRLLKYVVQYKWMMFQVIAALLISSLFQLILPFLTQSIVDIGIATRDISFITLILLGQMMLILGRTSVEFIRARVLMRVSVLINIEILSEFWLKLSKLPVSYYLRHKTGDVIQRLSDSKKVQNFITGTALNTLLSSFNFLVFTYVICRYSMQVCFVFLLSSFIYVSWIMIFLKVRRKINFQTFEMSAKENNVNLQFIQGMPEIKLYNATQIKRWEWEDIQTMLFKLNFKSLSYNQIQTAGAAMLSQGKDILITCLVARQVISGQLTIGTMLAIQYILGQLNAPIEQLISFVQNGQDARISMERLNEIHEQPDETDTSLNNIKTLPQKKDIIFSNVSFAYPGVDATPALSNINLIIPEGKVTAIVGMSGSGKTTILKLLLKFYADYKGDIRVGKINFRYFSPDHWRGHCGAVLQEGYIFNDSILHNVALGDPAPSLEKAIEACRLANIDQFIQDLPNGYFSQIGNNGQGISQGQKQRILMARAIYKSPEYLFLDEATNSLDANNEKIILENLAQVFKGKTVVVIAHRLSTVKNADQIVVMKDGAIVEVGTHDELCDNHGGYFQLVRNQLQVEM